METNTDTIPATCGACDGGDGDDGGDGGTSGNDALNRLYDVVAFPSFRQRQGENPTVDLE